MATAADAFSRVLEAFDSLGIAYLVGGSVASSIHGISRPTMGVDIVADLTPRQIEPLVRALGSAFYADAEMMLQALGRGRPFNLIHIPSTFKIDVFPLGRDEFSQKAFSRRKVEESHSFGPQPVSCSVGTAEDTLLRKLERYRAGGEVSERQWNDLRGIVRVRGQNLNLEYLRQWSGRLGVSDLLERLLAEKV